MAYAKPTAFTAWSFSRWNDYMQCPLRAKLRHLEKLKTPAMLAHEKGLADGSIAPGPMERGADIANKAEKFLNAPKAAKTPMELMPLAATYRELKKIGNLSVEDNWGFTKDWKACSPTDWNNCWLRVKIDVAYIDETKAGDTFHIRDNKTGKMSTYKLEEYALQLDLYGTAAMSRMATVTKATSQLLFSDLGVLHPPQPVEYLAKDLRKMQQAWEKRVRPMFNDTRFSPRPGQACRYCDFSKAKGGPCKY